MDTSLCSTIKTSLGEHFLEEVDVSSADKYCIVTLPLRTLDDRSISLIVEERLGGYFLVHDGGSTDSALFSQGIKLTEKKDRDQHAITRRYGVHIEDGMIQQACSRDGINRTILAVAQSMLLAAHEVLHHRPDFADVPINKQVGQALDVWKPTFILRIERDVSIARETTLRLNYVAHARDNRPSCMVKIIPPTHPTWQAQRYGFLGHELNQQPIIKEWRRLAILTRAETWPNGALQTVRRFSTRTIELGTGHEREIPFLVPQGMDEIYGIRR